MQKEDKLAIVFGIVGIGGNVMTMALPQIWPDMQRWLMLTLFSASSSLILTSLSFLFFDFVIRQRLKRGLKMVPVVSITCGLFLILFGVIYHLADKTPAGKGTVAKSNEKIQDIKCGGDSYNKDCLLKIDAYGYELPHPDGADVDGIKWDQATYSDVRVTLINESLTRIQNISFILKPETHVRKVVQPTNIPGVIVSPDYGPVKDTSLIGKDNSGKAIDMPVQTNTEYIVPQVKLHGSELLAQSEVKIVMACIAMKPIINGEWPNNPVDPRKPPK